MKKFLSCLTIIAVLLMSSCSSVEVLTLDQLYPAEINFPEQMNTVGVVNNIPSRPELKKNILKSGILDGDGKSATESLASAIADSKYFYQVIICDSALQENSIPEYLSGEEVEYLTSMLDVDVLFSFEKLYVDVQKKDYRVPEWGVSIPVISAEVSPEVAVYIPGREKPLITISPKDTLVFDAESRLSEKVLMDEVVHKISSEICNKIVPHWKQVDRIYFAGGGVEMRDAGVYLREGNWEGARNEWMKLYNRLKKGNVKFKSAFNIALSYEMTGDMQKAEEWLEESSKYLSSKSLEEQAYKYYKKELEERISVFNKLSIQMNRFN